MASSKILPFFTVSRGAHSIVMVLTSRLDDRDVDIPEVHTLYLSLNNGTADLFSLASLLDVSGLVSAYEGGSTLANIFHSGQAFQGLGGYCRMYPARAKSSMLTL